MPPPPRDGTADAVGTAEPVSRGSSAALNDVGFRLVNPPKAPWDPEEIPVAGEEDIPIMDLGPYLEALASTGNEAVLAERRQQLGKMLSHIGMNIGFHCVINHGVPQADLDAAMDASRRLHTEVPDSVKAQCAMGEGRRDGVGYMQLNNQKLPVTTVELANVNQAFVVKRELGPRNITLDHMPWPADVPSAGFSSADFQATVSRLAGSLERLALQMLPLYAEALGMPPDYFDAAFREPLYRMRLSRYPRTPPGNFGINPHVDTSFFTLLYASGPGLVVHSLARNEWLRVQHVPAGIIVNTGQLLAQITNDRWTATRHYALNGMDRERYSIPFFFNASIMHELEVVPSCVSEDRPAKYHPLSYFGGAHILTSQ